MWTYPSLAYRRTPYGCVQVLGRYSKPYDLQVTTLQALALLVFNSRSVAVRVGLPPQRLVGSLSCIRFVSFRYPLHRTPPSACR